MASKHAQQRSEIGLVGLDVKGRHFALNAADHGFSVAGYDTNRSRVDALRKESAERNIRGAANVPDFIALLRKPRAIMMLAPAGEPVDAIIKDLLPHLDKGDLLIDAGTSHSNDTALRTRNLAAEGIQYMGVDVLKSGEKTQHGPSIISDWLAETYELVRPLLEAVRLRRVTALRA